MRSNATRQSLTGLVALSVLALSAIWLWYQLPDVEPARLQQECEDNLQEMYRALVDIGSPDDFGSDLHGGPIEERLIDDANRDHYRYLMRCPGAKNEGLSTQHPQYHFNTTVDLRQLVDGSCDKSTILICDKFDNHVTSGGQANVNFLLADGSVVVINKVDANSFATWLGRFTSGDAEAMRYPPPGIDVISSLSTTEPCKK